MSFQKLAKLQARIDQLSDQLEALMEQQNELLVDLGLERRRGDATKAPAKREPATALAFRRARTEPARRALAEKRANKPERKKPGPKPQAPGKLIGGPKFEALLQAIRDIGGSATYKQIVQKNVVAEGSVSAYLSMGVKQGDIQRTGENVKSFIYHVKK